MKKIMGALIFCFFSLLIAREPVGFDMPQTFDHVQTQPDLNDHVYEKNPNRAPASFEPPQINGDKKIKREIKSTEEKETPQLGHDNW